MILSSSGEFCLLNAWNYFNPISEFENFFFFWVNQVSRDRVAVHVSVSLLLHYIVLSIVLTGVVKNAVQSPSCLIQIHQNCQTKSSLHCRHTLWIPGLSSRIWPDISLILWCLYFKFCPAFLVVFSEKVHQYYLSCHNQMQKSLPYISLALYWEFFFLPYQKLFSKVSQGQSPSGSGMDSEWEYHFDQQTSVLLPCFFKV